MLSNGLEAKIGSITAGWEHFAEWKRLALKAKKADRYQHHDQWYLSTAKVLDIIENFIVFIEESGGLVKIVSKNHQYLGVNNSMAAVHQLQENQGKLEYSGTPKAVEKASP